MQLPVASLGWCDYMQLPVGAPVVGVTEPLKLELSAISGESQNLAAGVLTLG